MKILFIGPKESTFVKNDIEILSEKHELIIQNSIFGKGLVGLKNLIKSIFNSFNNIRKVDAVFCWFADYASLTPILLAKLLKKKSFVVGGGFDVQDIPHLKVGAKAKKLRWYFIKYSFKNVKKIFPVSDFAEHSLFNVISKKVAPTKVIYNCINYKIFQDRKSKDINRKYVITVASVDSMNEYMRKGCDQFIEIARKMPKYEFILAGLRGITLDEAKKKSYDLKNLKIIPGFISLYNDIIPLYYQSFAYCQLSVEETFGVAVIEAMACGCAPLTSGNGALEEITRGIGYICKTDDEIISAILHSSKIEEEDRNKFSLLAADYDISIRKKILLSEIENC